jgi:ribose-phosphate pyrophosphokinase
MELGRADVGRFSDGEVNVEIHENVRGCDAFLLQSTCEPTNDNIMELMIMADAIRRASAHRITAVIPYYGYARQDRRPRSARVSISAKVVADMLGSVGIDRILTVDLHADQIQGFFDMPVDNVYGSPVLLDAITARKYENPIVVSPDVGGVVRARAIAKQIDDLDLAIIDKRRPKANETRVMNVIGDVAGKTCILVDDLVDTAGTLCTAAEALKDEGAIKVVAYITHAVFSGPAIERISASNIDEVVVTDTIPLCEAATNCSKIQQLSLDRLLAEAIRRVSNEESISAMFR